MSEQPTRPRTSSVRGFILETLQTLILAVVLYFLIDTVVARVRVENISMQPTLQPGEFILVNKFAYRLGEVRRGDIIVFQYPQNPQEDFIKRVIGLPGDHIQIDEGRLIVNNHLISEDYISSPPAYSGEWVVPENNLFVLGDNRPQSSDSHSWGFVPMENVIGRALMIYWPLDEMRVLNTTLVVSAANE
ncbi:MAG: signal peptidase I [Anaerolineae bacterium]|nr:signal peptidase I [Anaerolineae bacterium]